MIVAEEARVLFRNAMASVGVETVTFADILRQEQLSFTRAIVKAKTSDVATMLTNARRRDDKAAPVFLLDMLRLADALKASRSARAALQRIFELHAGETGYTTYPRVVASLSAICSDGCPKETARFVFEAWGGSCRRADLIAYLESVYLVQYDAIPGLHANGSVKTLAEATVDDMLSRVGRSCPSFEEFWSYMDDNAAAAAPFVRRVFARISTRA